MGKKLNQEKLKNFITRTQDEIIGCDSCGPQDLVEFSEFRGERIEMIEFLNNLDIPEKYHSDVAEALVCPNYSICQNRLNIFAYVYIQADKEEKVNPIWAEWSEKYVTKFEEFYHFLSEFPYLGVQYELGKQLLNRIQELPKDKIVNSTFYRARKIENAKLMSTQDMYPPDPYKNAIPEGRFNHFGQRVFYLAASQEGAAREVLDEDEMLVWLQEFRLKNFENILDLSPGYLDEPPLEIDQIAFGLIYGGVLQREVKRLSGWKPEYFIPRYIADCARKCGFSGIQFRSTKHNSNNLVLFLHPDQLPSTDLIEAVGNPFLYNLEDERRRRESIPAARF
jgi:hypothetical protein